MKLELINKVKKILDSISEDESTIHALSNLQTEAKHLTDSGGFQISCSGYSGFGATHTISARIKEADIVNIIHTCELSIAAAKQELQRL